jgi:hypothetical protein
VIPRGVDGPSVLGGCTVGAAVLAACVAGAADGAPLSAVRFALVPLAAAAAVVLDEASAAAVEAVPRTRRRRWAARAAATLFPFAVWGAGVLALEQRDRSTHLGALLLEGAGVLCTAVALAAVLRLAGRSTPGEIAGSLVGAAILGVLAFHPPPRSAPIFPTDGGWAASNVLWSGVAVVAIAVTVIGAGDRPRPAERRLRLRPLH